MEEPLTELTQVSHDLASTPARDFETLRLLLQKRAQVLNQIAAMPPAQDVYLALQQASEDTRRLHILIQAERRSLCLEAASLRNRQRLASEIQDSRTSRQF